MRLENGGPKTAVVMPQQGQLGRDEKIWRRWSRKTDPQNTNQIAKATIEKFVEHACRLYEQEREKPEGPSALGSYVRRWIGWAQAGLPSGIEATDLFVPTTALVS